MLMPKASSRANAYGLCVQEALVASVKIPIKKQAEVSEEALMRIFTVPENENSTLGRLEKQISENLIGFLKNHTVASSTLPSELERDFTETNIPEDPIFVSEQAQFLLEKVVSQSVHTMAPSFVGHMTSALPYFMLPLAKIMIALNQNVVKIETSKAFTPLERQVLGMVHRLIFREDEGFYDKFTHNYDAALGTICSNGTIANITALWVALNRLLKADGTFPGVGDAGVIAGALHHGYKNIAILVSERGHYSLRKAANLLGLGRSNLIGVATDGNNRIRLDELRREVKRQQELGTGIATVVGIGGTTETGNIDNLDAIADICAEAGVHFHADAAWGGPTLFSKRYRNLLKGIERADSVTFDAHKQLYVPMGAGMVLFKDPHALNLVEHHASYIIRKGSRDLGRWTLEGGRPGMAMLIHSGLRIIGRRGYEMLIDRGIDLAKTFAAMITKSPDFELITAPELNLLTYRWVPPGFKAKRDSLSAAELQNINLKLNQLTIQVQKEQRERGQTFVSRTTLNPLSYNRHETTVFRVVLANPLTTEEILQEILDEQRQLATQEWQSLL